MNQQGSMTAYFDNESDAQRAAEELHDQGIHAETRSSSSHGESFWETIKDFFSGHEAEARDRYGSGSVLIIEDDGSQSVMIAQVVTRYNGTMTTRGSTMGESDSYRGGTSTGEVDYSGGMRDDMRSSSDSDLSRNI